MWGSSSQVPSSSATSLRLQVSELLALGSGCGCSSQPKGCETFSSEDLTAPWTSSVNQSLQVLLSDPSQPVFFVSAFYSLVISVPACLFPSLAILDLLALPLLGPFRVPASRDTVWDACGGYLGRQLSGVCLLPLPCRTMQVELRSLCLTARAFPSRAVSTVTEVPPRTVGVPPPFWPKWKWLQGGLEFTEAYGNKKSGTHCFT